MGGRAESWEREAGYPKPAAPQHREQGEEPRAKREAGSEVSASVEVERGRGGAPRVLLSLAAPSFLISPPACSHYPLTPLCSLCSSPRHVWPQHSIYFTSLPLSAAFQLGSFASAQSPSHS